LSLFDTESIGRPFNVVHKYHVTFEFEWQGNNPEEIFRIEEKLGQGYNKTLMQIHLSLIRENQTEGYYAITRNTSYSYNIH
jgi:hypothetical protein